MTNGMEAVFSGSYTNMVEGDLAVWFGSPGGGCILVIVDSPAGEFAVNLLYDDTFVTVPLDQILLVPREAAHPDLGKLIGKRWQDGNAAWQEMKPYKLS